MKPGPATRTARLRPLAASLVRRTVPVLVALLGATIGILLVPSTSVEVGPLTASVHLRPSLDPRTVILLPPVGEVAFDTHVAPVRIEGRVQGVDIAAANRLLTDDAAIARLEKEAPDALTSAAIRNAGLNALFAAIGAATAVGLTYRRVRRAAVSGIGAIAVVAAGAGTMGATFRPQALYQPQFEGLLSQAAYVADLGTATAADYSSYRRTLAEFVSQVSALYVAADSLPVGADPANVITVLHVSDIHDNPQAFDVIQQLTEQFPVALVIDTGDIVSWGTPWENGLLRRIGTLPVPYVYIAGNHDGQGAIATVAAQPNAVVLQNQVVTVEGLDIAGIGDPRFAADDDSDSGGKAQGAKAVAATAFQLGDTIEAYDQDHPEDPVDLALIHDPTKPEGLLGRVPLVLSGHMHKNQVDVDLEGSGTTWMRVGSTGGALASGGVRPVLDGGAPLDLSARMLHFDRTTKRLIAYDDITMGGLGLVSVSIQRHQVPAEDVELTVPEDATSPPDAGEEDVSVSPGETVPDSERVTPSDAASPVPSSPPASESSPAQPPATEPTPVPGG